MAGIANKPRGQARDRLADEVAARVREIVRERADSYAGVAARSGLAKSKVDYHMLNGTMLRAPIALKLLLAVL